MPKENLDQLFAGGWLTCTVAKQRGGKGSNLDNEDPTT